MKTILFPTDFSECSENALNWTIGLAEKFSAKILLHNSCHLPTFSMQIPFEGLTEEQVFAEATQNMNDFIKKNKLESKGVSFESSVSVGLASDEIVSLAKEMKVDMVIMGTKGATGLEKVLLGSNASAVIERCSCPVIAVPENAEYRGMDKIVFATDYNDNDLMAIKLLTELAMPFMSEIIIVHISSITGTDTLERDKFSKYKEETLKKIHYEKLSFQLAVGLNTEENLDTILDEQDADLLAMSMRKRNIFSRLFSPSLTKKMSYHSKVPILSFHTS